MSNKNSGHILLHAFKEIFISCLRILAVFVGWSAKAIGLLLTKIGEFTLKFSEK